MKKFISNLLLFIAPLFIIGIILQVLLVKIPSDYKYKKEYLDQNASKIKTLCLGSSHIYYGINPDYMKANTFNASYVAQYLNYDLAILEKYKNDWKNLKSIVIPIDYFSLYGRLETTTESWRKKNYVLYYDISFDNDIADRVEILSQFKANILKIYSFYYLKENSITCTKLGWGFGFDSEKKNDLLETGKNAALRHSSKDDKYFNENLQVLQSIIKFARDRNIQVYMVTTPANKTYTENLNKLQLYRTINIAQKLASANSNVHYNNFLNNVDFDENDFYDADHLNDLGAKKFTLKIDSIITN